MLICFEEVDWRTNFEGFFNIFKAKAISTFLTFGSHFSSSKRSQSVFGRFHPQSSADNSLGRNESCQAFLSIGCGFWSTDLFTKFFCFFETEACLILLRTTASHGHAHAHYPYLSKSKPSISWPHFSQP